MKDRFSAYANQYAKFRPGYPEELVRFLGDNCIKHVSAWDCGTGNGQVARLLTRHFDKVFATDISESQIGNSVEAGNIIYSIQPAEATQFDDDSFDLITVGQAIHWFDLDRFFNEARRVGKNGSLIATFGYSPLRAGDQFNQLINDFYFNVIYPYWDSERKLVDDKYESMSFPFDEIPSPEFRMNYSWRIEEVEGYLNTWSAIQRYISETGTNPVNKLMDQLKSCWKSEYLDVYFPIFSRVGYIKK
jgi:ubiquinone/menaquinone biosynthesis C-methylase UbiE